MMDSHVNLAARRLGAGVIAASDEFFGEKENLSLIHISEPTRRS